MGGGEAADIHRLIMIKYLLFIQTRRERSCLSVPSIIHVRDRGRLSYPREDPHIHTFIAAVSRSLNRNDKKTKHESTNFGDGYLHISVVTSTQAGIVRIGIIGCHKKRVWPVTFVFTTARRVGHK